MSRSYYDTARDWDLGNVALKPKPQLDHRQYPVGHFNGNPEITAIIQGIRKRLERRIEAWRIES